MACVPQTGSGEYPALVADGHFNIHHGVLACFDSHTLTQMILDLERARGADGYRPGSHAVLRRAGDRVEVCAEQIGGLRRYDVVGRDPGGLHPIGTHMWPWLRTDIDRS